MIQSLTKAAARVMFFAIQEALPQGRDVVDTEHILLSLVREDNVACRLLLKLGIKPEQVRTGLAPDSPKEALRGFMKPELSAAAKSVMKNAIDEANALGEKYAGTEHLLLGLLLDNEGRAGVALREVGITSESVRAALLKLQSEGI